MGVMVLRRTGIGGRRSAVVRGGVGRPVRFLPESLEGSQNSGSFLCLAQFPRRRVVGGRAIPAEAFVVARISSYRELEVWGRSMALARTVYQLTAALPKHELFGLTSQIRRAAVSIPANVAEGHNRRSRRAFHYHVSVALGSQAELGTLLDLVEGLGYCTPSAVAGPREEATRVGMMLHGLARALEATVQPRERRPPIPDRRSPSQQLY